MTYSGYVGTLRANKTELRVHVPLNKPIGSDVTTATIQSLTYLEAYGGGANVSLLNKVTSYSVSGINNDNIRLNINGDFSANNAFVNQALVVVISGTIKFT